MENWERTLICDDAITPNTKGLWLTPIFKASLDNEPVIIFIDIHEQAKLISYENVIDAKNFRNFLVARKKGDRLFHPYRITEAAKISDHWFVQWEEEESKTFYLTYVRRIFEKDIIEEYFCRNLVNYMTLEVSDISMPWL